MHEASDEELMIRMAEGDVQSFEVLYLRHRAKAFGYLLSQSRDHSVAEDLLQETFERVYKKAHTFDPKASFLPWMFTIMKNALTDRMRKSLRDQRLELQLVTESQVENELPSIDLDELPERYRTALKLRYIEDRDFDEIAQEMSLSVSNARQLVSRAIRRLKKSGVKK